MGKTKSSGKPDSVMQPKADLFLPGHWTGAVRDSLSAEDSISLEVWFPGVLF